MDPCINSTVSHPFLCHLCGETISSTATADAHNCPSTLKCQFPSCSIHPRAADSTSQVLNNYVVSLRNGEPITLFACIVCGSLFNDMQALDVHAANCCTMKEEPGATDEENAADDCTESNQLL